MANPWLSDEEIERLTALDRAHFFHAATPLKEHARTGPKIFTRGEGIYLYDAKGNRYVDGLGVLWAVNCGHGRREIVDAVADQMRELAFSTSFFGFAHPTGIELAARLAELTPPGLDRLFFVGSGSEAAETAIKLARAYHKVRGKTGKVKVVSRVRAYHGATYGVLSATRLRQYHQYFEPLMQGVLEAPAPYRYRCEFCSTTGGCTTQCATDLEAIFQREGPDTVAMFIAEPVQGAGGVIVPPPEYLPLVREICRRNDVLFVADEVINGFGRTGRMFGVNHWDVVPDMMTLGKGLTSGYMPLSATAVSEEIYRTLVERPEAFAFWHGFTFNAHPGCCAAALKTLEIIAKESLVERSEILGRRLLQRLRALERCSIVGEVRGLGLLAGVELVQDKASRAPFPDGRAGALVRRRCLEKGVIVRALGDIIALCPPLVISEAEVDALAATIGEAIEETEREVRGA
ncbi:MAG: aspartate aminotransferase family protein [Candidatus Rokubacteria bacterium]|nr:aspartate aminotransferase family protein [Candidatus Rokubacteria bacterium]